jgi:hypothetical protein
MFTTMLENKFQRQLANFIPLFFVITRSVFRLKFISAKLRMSFAVDERRSNLSSLIEHQEPFGIFRKITPLQNQSREIASGMMQHLAQFVSGESFAEPRNDKLWCVAKYPSRGFIFS